MSNGETELPSSDRPAGGQVDFSKYSIAQLHDLQLLIDPISSPDNHRRLLEELERRQASSADEPIPVRFTEAEGWRGWWQAKRLKRSLFGHGSISVSDAGITLRGYQRTWLGVAQSVELAIPMAHIRNVGCESTKVRFQHRKWSRRHIAFQMATSEEAQHLASQLPDRRSKGFGTRWEGLLAFNHQMDQIGAGYWVTKTLVALNVLYFLICAFREKSIQFLDARRLIEMGANYGVQVADGEWWRLITAAFMHGDWLHLLLNMWVLWNAGKLTERLLGRWTFLFLYLSCSVLASLSTAVWDPTTISVGSSGAIFGVLGAFLAYLFRCRRTIPASVIRAHWFSTLLFVLVSLARGMTSELGIDNGAHVGGLLSGLALGLLLARPLKDVAAQRFKPALALSAATLLLLGVASSVWQITGSGTELTGPDRYWKTHGWFLKGQTDNLIRWDALSTQAGNGSISVFAMGNAFDAEITPFWVDAQKRLSQEKSSTVLSERRFAEKVSAYVDARLAWAQAISAVAKGESEETIATATQMHNKSDVAAARVRRVEILAALEHRPRALRETSLVKSIQRLFTAKLECVQPSNNWDKLPAASDSPTDTPKIKTALACEFQNAYRRSDFAELEKLWQKASAQLTDLPDGRSSLAALVEGVDDYLTYSQVDWQDELARVTKWHRAYPKSPMPDLFEATVFDTQAWSVRGNGFAKTVSAQAWAEFAASIEMSSESLKDASDAAKQSPVWYQLSIANATSQSTEVSGIRQLYEEGITKFPGYDPLDRAMLRELMPRWGGSYEQVAAFIDDQSRKLEDQDRDARYAALFWTYSRLEDDDTNIFDDVHADWNRVKSGFEAMLRRYPTSDSLLNSYAVAACQANDMDTFELLQPQVKKRFSTLAWTDKYSVEACDRKKNSRSAAASAPVETTPFALSMKGARSADYGRP